MRFGPSTTAIAGVILVLAACGKTEAPASAPSVSESAVEQEASNPETPMPTPEPAVIVEATEKVISPFAELPAPYNTAGYNLARRTWKLCQSCHMTAEGAGSLVGPNLYGLFGRKAGAGEGFTYSDALQTADFVWTPEKVDHWLENPRTFLPGNRMSFAGVRRPEDRTAVIAYLMSETGYKPDTPAE